MHAIAELRPELDESEDVYYLIAINETLLQILTARGDILESRTLSDWLGTMWARGSLDLQDGATCLIAPAAERALAGDADGALSRLRECVDIPGIASSYGYVTLLVPSVRIALQCGDPRLASDLCEGVPVESPYARHAMALAKAMLTEEAGLWEAGSDAFAEAAAGWHAFGAPYEEAHALLGQGRCLVALGRAPEAAPVLEAAREIFARLKAKPALNETEGLLAQTGTATQ